MGAARNAQSSCLRRTPTGEVDVADPPCTMARCALALVADVRLRAIGVHHAGGQHARGAGPRVSAGHVAAAGNAGERDRLHQRMALVRRRRGRLARLGLRPVPVGAHSQPRARDHVFGRSVLGRPLSRATVVLEPIELEQLGVAGVPAATSAVPAAPPARFAAPVGKTAEQTAAGPSQHGTASRRTAAWPGRQPAIGRQTAPRWIVQQQSTAAPRAIARQYECRIRASFRQVPCRGRNPAAGRPEQSPEARRPPAAETKVRARAAAHRC